MPSGWVRAVRSEDLARGARRRVELEGRAVLVLRLEDGRLVAANPRCPHEGHDLSEGMLWFGQIDCPWHHWTFDLATGENIYPRRVFPADLAAQCRPLRLYETREAEGWIEVCLRDCD
jgi:nitrite reductase/ring-hydroxylating ferredoxin subunit